MPPCPAPPGPSRAKSEGLCVTAHFVSSPASLPCVTRKAQAVGSSAAGAKDTGGSLWPRPCGDGTAGMAQGPQRSVRAAGPDRRGRTATHRGQAPAHGHTRHRHGTGSGRRLAPQKKKTASLRRKERKKPPCGRQGAHCRPLLPLTRQFTPLGYGQDGDSQAAGWSGMLALAAPASAFTSSAFWELTRFSSALRSSARFSISP
jgi:hypothetical protein